MCSKAFFEFVKRFLKFEDIGKSVRVIQTNRHCCSNNFPKAFTSIFVDNLKQVQQLFCKTSVISWQIRKFWTKSPKLYTRLFSRNKITSRTTLQMFFFKTHKKSPIFVSLLDSNFMFQLLIVFSFEKHRLMRDEFECMFLGRMCQKELEKRKRRRNGAARCYDTTKNAAICH